MYRNCASVCTLLLCLQTNSPAFSQELYGMGAVEGVEYSPYLQEDFPNQVLFGDTHLHTSYSADAGLVGATTTPNDAYRFAKGEEVVSSNGVRARLQRPLDWLVVTDHAENLGLPAALEENDPVLVENEWGQRIAEIYGPRTDEARLEAYGFWMDATFAGEDPLAGTAFGQTMWERVTAAAERHNVPGAFSALIGFEWTSQPGGNNMHRNVVFRDGKSRADQMLPISSFDSDDPEVLWQWMAKYEEDTGGKVFAIPHNGNISNGLMFDDVTLSGEPLSAGYAERRQRWEPLYEVTQIKGDGETHPMLSPDDEFADYGTWDRGVFGAEPRMPDMIRREYAREAWKRGMVFASDIGLNPFKFGVIGSTDAHTGLSTAQENNFFGKVAMVEPTSDPIRFEEAITGRFTTDTTADDILSAEGLASGLAAVWARENTREALWDAMKRREVYATTGTRMRVRVFAGYGFQEGDLSRSNFAEHGYSNGVPMGADLGPSPDGSPPKLMIRALRDPDGANLDRIQVVKGWVEADGSPMEQVFDVAWSDGRALNSDGKLPPVGDTVDGATATYSNSIGAAFLEVVWEDSDFDVSESAFYYVRVIEVPTPRWTTYDSVFFGIDIPAGIPLSQQERAYTSPIWYTAPM